MIRITQSVLEKTSYLLLFLVFIASIFVGSVAYQDGRKLTQLTQSIKNNQQSNALAIKTYIACLINIPPSSTNIEGDERRCFDDAPSVK